MNDDLYEEKEREFFLKLRMMHDRIQRIANEILHTAFTKDYTRQQDLLRQHEKAVKADLELIDEFERFHSERSKKRP